MERMGRHPGWVLSAARQSTHNKETKDETSNRFSHYQCSGATATRIRREDNHETNSSAGKERPRSRRPGRGLARALVRFRTRPDDLTDGRRAGCDLAGGPTHGSTARSV